MKAFKKILVCVMVAMILSCSMEELQVYASEVEEPIIQTQSTLKDTTNTDLILQVTKTFYIRKGGKSHYAASVLGDATSVKKTEVTVIFQRYNTKKKKWEKGLTFYTPREETFAATAGDIQLSQRGKFRLKVIATVTPYKGSSQTFSSYSETASW